jgi:hypothetical protein
MQITNQRKLSRKKTHFLKLAQIYKEVLKQKGVNETVAK